MIIIKNGALVTPQGLRRADLAMDGDKIVRIAAAIEPAEGDTVEDAAGCWAHRPSGSSIRSLKSKMPAYTRYPIWLLHFQMNSRNSCSV